MSPLLAPIIATLTTLGIALILLMFDPRNSKREQRCLFLGLIYICGLIALTTYNAEEVIALGVIKIAGLLFFSVLGVPLLVCCVITWCINAVAFIRVYSKTDWVMVTVFCLWAIYGIVLLAFAVYACQHHTPNPNWKI